jgi:dUTP pyrophosphatase
MVIKYKKLIPQAQEPQKATEGDAGFDLIASSFEFPQDGSDYVEAKTGLSLEIPEGYVGLVFPRSSISKTRHFLRNSVGVIDSGYRGEIKLRFTPDMSRTSYSQGDKVGQIVFLELPAVTLTEAEELTYSQRGEGGFGSTGN